MESKPGPHRDPAGRAGEALIAQLRQVNAEVLAVADELSRGTIDTVLAKSDLELGIEALMRGSLSARQFGAGILRRTPGLSKADVAKRAGVSVRTVERVMSETDKAA